MENWSERELKYRYMMLGVLQIDCEYHLNTENAGNLLAGNRMKQIQAMKDIWGTFSEEEKPEWITWENILELERQLCKGDK